MKRYYISLLLSFIVGNAFGQLRAIIFSGDRPTIWLPKENRELGRDLQHLQPMVFRLKLPKGQKLLDFELKVKSIITEKFLPIAMAYGYEDVMLQVYSEHRREPAEYVCLPNPVLIRWQKIETTTN